MELGCRTFASIVETDACPTATGGLRKDYAYLFERFFYFLEDNNSREQGIVVFDELEKSQSHLLIDQTTERHETNKGNGAPKQLQSLHRDVGHSSGCMSSLGRMVTPIHAR